MGNYSCTCDFCHTNFKSEQNLSRENISTEKISNNNSNISIFFQNNYMIGLNSNSTNIYPSITKFKNFNKNKSLSSELNHLQLPNKEIENNEIEQIKEINEKKEILPKKEDNDKKNNAKINLKSNKKIENIESKKHNLNDDNIFKNKRKNIDLKNSGISQSTKVLNESDLNSALLKSTVYEYK